MGSLHCFLQQTESCNEDSFYFILVLRGGVAPYLTNSGGLQSAAFLGEVDLICVMLFWGFLARKL